MEANFCTLPSFSKYLGKPCSPRGSATQLSPLPIEVQCGGLICAFVGEALQGGGGTSQALQLGGGERSQALTLPFRMELAFLLWFSSRFLRTSQNAIFHLSQTLHLIVSVTFWLLETI